MSVSGHARPDTHRAYWETRYRRLAARLFLGRVLEYLGPALLTGALLSACLLLLARLHVLPAWWGPPVGLVPLFASVIVALLRAVQRGWPKAADVRVRLEQACGLHNRLSAASEGTIAYPPPPAPADDATRDVKVVIWRWDQVLPLPAASLALLLAALLIPVQPPTATSPPITQKPPPLERLEEIVQRLEPARAIDERTLEELRNQVEELAQRDPEAWYTHASLEAAESLLQKTESGLNELASHLTTAAQAVDQMVGAGDSANQSAQQAGGLQAAMQGLEHGRMPGAADITQRLREAAGRQLDPQTAQQLADALRQHADFLQQLAQAAEGRPMQFTQLGAGSSPGNPGGTDSASGEEPGQGGVSHGPGTAPLTIAQNPTTAQPGTEGALEGFDPTRAALGDAAGLSVGQHEIDRETANTAATGGELANTGTGGEAAWTQRLTPAERRAVRRTFE